MFSYLCNVPIVYCNSDRHFVYRTFCIKLRVINADVSHYVTHTLYDTLYDTV